MTARNEEEAHQMLDTAAERAARRERYKRRQTSDPRGLRLTFLAILVFWLLVVWAIRACTA